MQTYGKNPVSALIISVIFKNIPRASFCRSMTRDPIKYKDPEEFKPERFLEPCTAEVAQRMDPRNYVFGFGRRSVPMEISLSSFLLWQFLIKHAQTVSRPTPCRVVGVDSHCVHACHPKYIESGG